MAVLVIAQPGSPSNYVELSVPLFRVGRAADCELVLQGQFVSRHHAEIRNGEDRCELVDLGSSNGTSLNGQQLEPNIAYELKDGDTFKIEDYSIGFVASHEEDKTFIRNKRAPDELYVDIEAMEVWIGQRVLSLRQARVLKLLAYLYVNRGRVCSEEELGDHVWPREAGSNSDVPQYDASSLYQLIYLARKAIESTTRKPRYLVNVPGLGYRLYEFPQTAD